MVTVFEIWRYFPLSFLFILARMQSIDQTCTRRPTWTAPRPSRSSGISACRMLMGILSVLFLLRFIWTFNKFDDIFLLTGGNAGTRTLTVNVYEQAFALSNIGAGAAVAVVILCACWCSAGSSSASCRRRRGCERRHEFEEAVIRFLIAFGYVFFTAIVLIPFYVMVMTSLKNAGELMQTRSISRSTSSQGLGAVPQLRGAVPRLQFRPATCGPRSTCRS
jgi:ABC-type sugar transport system permease subunit